MTFQAEVDLNLAIQGIPYRILEHPATAGIPYVQEGWTAVVYCLKSDTGIWALKVFKPRYRVPALVITAQKLQAFTDLPGLRVSQRTVLTPQHHGTLLRQHPDLTYAVLMPWIEGPTWQEVLLEKRPLAPEQALALARGLAEVLMGMEERGLAHCDLSAPNVLLPALAQSATRNSKSAIRNPQSPIELVDLEGLYAPGMLRPQTLSSGSAGYAHRQAADGLWGPEADRFAGAVLLVEMLDWCDLAVVQAAWGESYFDPQEMQQDCLRYRTLVEALQRTWGEAVATLFDCAWRSETLADCPTFGEWLLHLPPEPLAVTSVAAPPAADALSLLLARAQRLEKEGDWAGALRCYREARGSAANPALAVELDQIIAQLEQQRREQGRWEEQARQAQAHMRAGRWSEAAALYEALLREPAPASQRGAWQAALEQCREEVELAGLFAAAERAMAEGRWSAAAELLDAVARRRPDYAHGGRQVRDLRAAVARELARQQKRPTAGALWRALVTGLLAVLVVGGLGLGGWYLYTRWQEEEQQRAIAAATAQAAPWLTVTAQAQGTAQALATLQAEGTRQAEETRAAIAAERAQVTAQAQQTAEAMAAERATATAQAQRTAEAVAAERATATAQAGRTATAIAGERATLTAQSQRTATALAAERATATAEVRATEEAVARAATATSQAQATARAMAQVQATSQAATAIARSRQRPGLILDFEQDVNWRRGDQPYGQFERASDQVRAGNYAGRLRYDFPAVSDNFVVFLARPAITIAGQPTGITAWIYGDGSGHFLNVWIQDAAGEVRSYTFGQIRHQGWQQMTAWFDERKGWPNGHISGPDDGSLNFPVQFYAFVLDGVPDGQSSRGTIYIDEVFGTTEPIPAPAPPPPPPPPPATTRSALLPGPPDFTQVVRVGGLLSLGLLMGFGLVVDRPVKAIRRQR